MTKYRLTESRLRNMIRESVKGALNETYRYEYNSYDKALKIEKLMNTIYKCAQQLNMMVDDYSEFNGDIQEISYFAAKIISECDMTEWNANDYKDYDSSPEYDMRDLGYYGTDMNGNWKYDRDENDEGYQYWLNNTRKGRKFAKQQSLGK